MARVAIRRLETRTPFAEIDFARDSGVDHPLKGPVHRRPANPRVLAVNEVAQVVRAEMPFLTEEDTENPIAFRGSFAACRSKVREVGKGTIHASIVNSSYSTEKDWPHPQVDVAIGFLIVKPPPVIVSTKSTSAPLR